MRALKHHVRSAEGTDGLRDVVPPDEGMKVLRVMKHHVHSAEGTDGLRDVVPPDEGIRFCGP